jgi:hypothetical protein
MRYAIRQNALGVWIVYDPDNPNAEPRYSSSSRSRAMLAASGMYTKDLRQTLTAAGELPPPENGTPFYSIVAFQDVESADGRLFRNLQIRDMPLTLWWQNINDYGHDGAVIVGRFDTMEIAGDGMTVEGTGFYDGSEDAQAAIRQCREKTNYGISMDATTNDYASWECMEYSEEGFCVGRERTVYDGAVIVSATQVATPAFTGAQIALDAMPTFAPTKAEDAPEPPEGAGMDWMDWFFFNAEKVGAATGQPRQEVSGDTISANIIEDDCGCDESATDTSALVAAAVAAPEAPPSSWFEDPHLSGPTPLTIFDDGRIAGHIATWNTCHSGFPNECTLAPRSPSNYRYFHLGVVRTAEGTDVPVGTLTMDTGHAPSGSAQAALAHYDNTGSGVADIHCGEDEYGIWAAGCLRPGTNEDQIRALRSSGVSGDWRRERDARGTDLGLELRAVLACPVPGFPIPRAELAASGAVESLVAAGSPLLIAEQREPWKRELAELRAEMAILRAAQAPLLPLARARLRVMR